MLSLTSLKSHASESLDAIRSNGHCEDGHRRFGPIPGTVCVFKAARFSASLNCKYLFEVEDCTVNEAWTVDLWTKADSVTLFDEVTYGATK
jgi:hypothetical protein